MKFVIAEKQINLHSSQVTIWAIWLKGFLECSEKGKSGYNNKSNLRSCFLPVVSISLPCGDEGSSCVILQSYKIISFPAEKITIAKAENCDKIIDRPGQSKGSLYKNHCDLLIK